MVVAPLPIPFWVVPTGWVGAAVSLLLLGRALFWDWFRVGRFHQTRRCPKCWYDLRGHTDLRCPECGHEAKSERQLHRSNRRWRTAFFALGLYAISYVAVIAAKLAYLDFYKHLPNWLVVLVVPDPFGFNHRYSDPIFTPGERLLSELWQRYADRRLSLNQRRSVLHHAYTPNRPPVVLHSRSTWPRGVPIWYTASTAFDYVLPWNITLELPGSAPEQIAKFPWHMPERYSLSEEYVSFPQYTLTPEPLLKNAGNAATGTELHGRLKIVEAGDLVWDEAFGSDLTLVDSVDDAIQVIAGPAADADVSVLLSSQLRLSRDRAWLCVRNASCDRLTNMTLALRIELRHADQITCSCDLTWRDLGPRAESSPASAAVADPNGAPAKPPAGDWEDDLENHRPWDWRGDAEPDNSITTLITGDIAQLRSASLSDPAWTLRITGDPIAALRDLDSKKCWRGELTLPASILIAHP